VERRRGIMANPQCGTKELLYNQDAGKIMPSLAVILSSFPLERNIKAVVTMLWRSPGIIIRGGNFPGSLTSGYCVCIVLIR